jgi:molybdopterin-guanine dinucleotide biosynthesis protein MobB
MVAFSFVGWSNSGKTTLISELTRALRARHKSVAALKQTGHDIDLQPAGKDSVRLRQAGAAPVYLLNGSELVTIEPVGAADRVWQRLAAAQAGCDFFLLEGLRPPGVPLIEVIGRASDQGLKFPATELSAVVGDHDPGCAVPFFSRGDVAGIAGFMEAYHG